MVFKMTNVAEIKAVKVLANGVKVFNLTDITEADFHEAQSIIDSGMHCYIDAECAYEERVDNAFIGTYQVEIDSLTEYNRFIDMLLQHSLPMIPTLEQWKDNKIEVEGRTIRLGKWMKKESVDNDIIDFYSAQTRTGKERYYFTISDMPQHIAGMTYYASDWRSCQHPDSEESIHLAGSLHDDSLLVGMLHKDMEDLQDMDDKLLARVVMRIVEDQHDNVHLIPSRYYGNKDNRNKDIMDRCLVELDELNIHSRSIRHDDWNDESYNKLILTHTYNGDYEMTVNDIVWMDEHVEEEFTNDCPMCEGSGKIERWSERANDDVEFECPCCGGSGEVTSYFEEHVITEVDIETDAEIEPYQDDYSIISYQVRINVDAGRLAEHNNKWNKEEA